MLQDNLRKWENRIALLLAKAENDASTPAEQEAFLAKAHDLVDKYKIEWNRVRRTDGDNIQVDQITYVISETRSSVKEWKFLILSSIASVFYTRMLKLGSQMAIILGTPKDIEHTIAIYEQVISFVSTRCEVAALQAYNDGLIGRGTIWFDGTVIRKVHGRRWRKDFSDAASYQINRRCTTILNDRRQASTSTETALLVVSAEIDEAIDEYIDDEFGKLRTYSYSNRTPESRSAILAGRTAGSDAPLLDQIGETK